MSKREDLTDTLLDSPWWVSAGMGLLVWGATGALIASTSAETPFGKIVHTLAPLHWVIPIFFGATGIGAYVWTWRKRHLLARNRSLDRVRNLTWRQFETLTGQFYREQGYSVVETGGGGPDDGVDLLLRRGEERVIVQCKHWKAFSVGLREVKELFATVRDRGATGGVLVTTSHFSKDARVFAARHPDLQLLNGDDLGRMLGTMAPSMPATDECPNPPASAECHCPKCGSRMVTRQARTGRSAGSQFLGCTRYPACHGTISLSN